MDRYYVKIPTKNIMSPKFTRMYSNGFNKSKRIINNKILPKTTKYGSKTISDLNSNRNNILKLSNSTFFSSPRKNILQNIYRNLNKKSKQKKRNESFQKVLPFVINSKHHKRNQAMNNTGIENEKLFHQTYQMKKVIKELEKQLCHLSQDNLIRDKKLNEKEKEINDIINNNKTLEDEYKDEYIDNYNNDFNRSSANISNSILMIKIKREIKKINNLIENENQKLNYIKKLSYNTKLKEFQIESNILKQHSDKINLLLDNALQIKAKNKLSLGDYKNIQGNINRQEKIILRLVKDCNSLEKKEKKLNIEFNNLEKELKKKKEKKRKNNKELNILSIRNKTLNNDSLIKSNEFINIKNGKNPITNKSFDKNKLIDLKKNINFYKKQCKYTDDIINKLKEQRKKIIDSNKNFEPKIKIVPNFIDNTVNINNIKQPSAIGSCKTDEDIINELRKQYKKFRDEEIILEQKANKYYEKLQEIDLENIEKENEYEENQIEFGIDETNPYYTDNEDNVPESNMKFTPSQFNQFTYILFKNFESKCIIGDNAYNKLIIPFGKLIEKYNITNVLYPSKEFDIIIEEFTKIIMKALNTDNEYNYTMIKIFLGALLYNCECNQNKLVENLLILFGYIKDYSSEENILIGKLKTKYKNETKKLVECLTSYIFNDISSSPYFSLFKMKDLLNKNKINLKDKYIEFLFYYMKKFNDPDAKLDELKYSLLNDIVPLGETIRYSRFLINGFDKDKELENNAEFIYNKNEQTNKKISNKETTENNEMNKINKKENELINNFISKECNNNNNNNNNIENEKHKESKEKNYNELSEITSNNNIENKFKIKNKNNNYNNHSNENDISDKKDNNTNTDTDKDNDLNSGEIIRNKSENIYEDTNKNYIKNKNEDKHENNETKKNNKNNNNYANSENNKSNKPLFNNETGKEDNIETGNYEKNKKKINEKIEKDKKKTKSNSKKNLNKEDEDHMMENSKEDKKVIDKKEDEKSNDSNSNSNSNEKNEEDSLTEITNEEYKKQIINSLNIIQNALDYNLITFNNLIKKCVKSILICGEYYKYITIEELNDKLISLDVKLTDLQLSCICSRFSVPNKLKLIDEKKLEKGLRDNLKGSFKVE